MAGLPTYTFMNKSGDLTFRIVWVTRSFLDYRLPVFEQFNCLAQGNFYLAYSKEFTPERVWRRIEDLLGDRAIGLTGEKSFGYKGNITGEIANSKWRIPYQPGLTKILKDLSPDVLIGDGFFQWTWPAFLYRLFHKKPLVVCYERTAHTERNAQWFRILFRKIMIRYIDAMCVNGRLSREYVESLGVKSQDITLGHMVADTRTLREKTDALSEADKQGLKNNLMLGSDCTVFISISQLIERKGLHQLLDGWRRFKSGREDGEVLLIVGDGPERLTLEAYCQSHGLDSVKFIGAVDYHEVHRYFAISDVFVIATLEDNWSLVVPEAMACSKPILCSIYNGCWPELVHEGVNGWTFDPLNHQSIVDGLEKCVSPGVDLCRMGAESQGIVSGESAERAARSIMDACLIALKREEI